MHPWLKRGNPAVPPPIPVRPDVWTPRGIGLPEVMQGYRHRSGRFYSLPAAFRRIPTDLFAQPESAPRVPSVISPSPMPIKA